MTDLVAWTPGAYLKQRRKSAGLSVADVAAKLCDDARSAEHLRAEQIERIEADAQPASFATIVAIAACFPFDMVVLALLEAVSQGRDLFVPAICRICACTEHDPCEADPFGTCYWAQPDLCSACAELVAPSPQAQSPARSGAAS